MFSEVEEFVSNVLCDDFGLLILIDEWGCCFLIYIVRIVYVEIGVVDVCWVGFGVGVDVVVGFVGKVVMSG